MNDCNNTCDENNDICKNKTINKVVWLDIPVENLERATEFYSKLLNLEFTTH